MVRPNCFEFNAQTAETATSFLGAKIDESHEKALLEFDDLVETLRNYGVNVAMTNDSSTHCTPDAIFPTWLSFHYQHKGVALLYPMMAENRRLERRRDFLQKLSLDHGFRISDIYDLSPLEKDGEYLEGLGSLVLDRLNQVAYATVSPRTTLEALGRFSQYLDYKIIILQAYDLNGRPIYHTNLLMSVWADFAVVCTDAVANSQNQSMLRNRLTKTGREVITISMEQMHNFAANIIQLQNKNGEKLVVMSERAYTSFRAEQIQALSKHGKIISVAIPTIENVAGSSIGSLINPIFLPSKVARRPKGSLKKPIPKKKTIPSP